MRTLTALLVAAALLFTLAPPTPAQTPTDLECDYARLVVGCRRDVVIVPALPENAVRYAGSVHGFAAVCAHVGFDQTWCVVSGVAAVNPQPSVPLPVVVPAVAQAVPAFTG